MGDIENAPPDTSMTGDVMEGGAQHDPRSSAPLTPYNLESGAVGLNRPYDDSDSSDLNDSTRQEAALLEIFRVSLRDLPGNWKGKEFTEVSLPHLRRHWHSVPWERFHILLKHMTGRVTP